MNRVINLLNEKNHYLEKFYSLNETELVNFAQDQFGNIDYFYKTRERILDVVKYIDSQLDHVQAQMKDEASLSSEGRREVRQALAIKDEYVTRIIEQDIQILACIESAKNSIIKELQDVRKTKKAVGHYKTKMHRPRLNEEV